MEPILSPPAEHQPTFLSSNGRIDSSTESPPALPHAESYTPDEPLIPPVSEEESRLVSSTRRGKPRGYLVRAVLLTRLSAMVFSLLSFSLMAACRENSRNYGYPGGYREYRESFDESMEYRFCITMNILAFIYSTFQAVAMAYPIIFGENIIPLRFKLYFDPVLDQIFAYLLIAAGSSAAAIIKKTGNNDLAAGAVSMAFLAFACLAVSAIISAFAVSSHYLSPAETLYFHLSNEGFVQAHKDA